MLHKKGETCIVGIERLNYPWREYNTSCLSSIVFDTIDCMEMSRPVGCDIKGDANSAASVVSSSYTCRHRNRRK